MSDGASEDGPAEHGGDRPADPQWFVDEHGFLSWLGVTVEAFEPGRAVLGLPYRGRLTNAVRGSEGAIHGGVVATLIDTASGFALRTTFDDPGNAALTTTDLDVSYVRPATDDLRAEATVVRAGGSTGVTQVAVTSTAPDGEDKRVAIGNTTYRLFREDGR